jgi:hypothetical protein
MLPIRNKGLEQYSASQRVLNRKRQGANGEWCIIKKRYALKESGKLSNYQSCLQHEDVKKCQLCMISGFRRDLNEICALLESYAA